MSEIPFHATRMGQRFYEHTMPELVRQLTRLNESLEQLIDRREHPGGGDQKKAGDDAKDHDEHRSDAAPEM